MAKAKSKSQKQLLKKGEQKASSSKVIKKSQSARQAPKKNGSKVAGEGKRGGGGGGGKKGGGKKKMAALEIEEASVVLGGSIDDFDSPRKCRDLPWALLFLAQLGAVIGLGVFYGIREQDTFDFDAEKLLTTEARVLGPLIIVSGIIVASLFLLIVRNFPKFLVWSALLPSIVGEVAAVTYYFLIDEIETGVLFSVILFINLLWLYLIRRRIAFAAACLEVVVEVVRIYPSLFYMSVVGMGLLAVWVVVWLVAAAFAIDDITQRPDSTSAAGAVYILFLLSFYWTTQVIQNIIHTTIAGTMGFWYFHYPGTRRNPTMVSFRRAITKNLGSIALGSLLVSIMQLIRGIIHDIFDSRNLICKACCCCCLNCLDIIFQYFNVYAYSQIALTGKAYCEAAKDTWRFLMKNGFTVIVNDYLVGKVLAFGSFFGGFVVFVVAVATAELAFEEPLEDAQIVLWGTVGFLVGYTLVQIAMKVVSSAVSTLFVCYAMDKNVFRDTKMDTYEVWKDAGIRCYDKFPKAELHKDREKV